MKKRLIMLCIIALLNQVTWAQSVGPSSINASGGSTVVDGNTHEYAIGDVVAGSTYDGPGLVVTQGVLQPVVEDPNSIGQLTIDAAYLNVFPNPVEQTLFLQPGFNGRGVLEYVLTDLQGRILLQKKAPLEQGNERQQINMGHLAAAPYCLQVLWQQEGKVYTKAYKIQKIK